MSFGFEEYRGGAGPSNEHAYMNTYALFVELVRRGFDAEFVPDWELAYSDTPVPIVSVGNRNCGYDRWGFCDEDYYGLDQASWEEALEYMMGNNPPSHTN